MNIDTEKIGKKAEIDGVGHKYDRKQLIAVIGVPRSGTSAITKGLEALGINLGSYIADVKRWDNEKGFFEDVEINMLTQAMLNSIGYRWGNPVSPLYSEENRNILSVFYPVAKEIILRRFNDTEVFGFKDPLIAILLPFWNQLFKDCGVDASYLIACRNPLSVAMSLKKVNNNFDIVVCFYIWMAGMLSSLIYSEGYNRIVVDYDEVMEDPKKQLERIADKFGLEFNPESAGIKEYMDSFLTDSLRHTSFKVEDVMRHPEIPPKIAELYALSKRLAKDEAKMEDIAVAAHIKKIYAWANELRSTLLLIQAQSDALLSLKGALLEREKKIAELTEANKG